MDIIEKSRETVEQLLARRNLPKTYEEKCQYALDLVDMHLHEENPERIDECIKLYTEDAIWETPARNVSYRGRETIKHMYLRVFNAIGTVSNVASRLCDEAKPGQILISPRVLMALEDAVNVEPVGEFELKGISRPLAAYNVLSAVPAKI